MIEEKKKMYSFSLVICFIFQKKYQIYAPALKSPQALFLLNFLVNLSDSTVWKVPLFIYASAF